MIDLYSGIFFLLWGLYDLYKKDYGYAFLWFIIASLDFSFYYGII